MTGHTTACQLSNPKIVFNMLEYLYADPRMSLWHCFGPVFTSEKAPCTHGCQKTARVVIFKTEYYYINIMNHSCAIRGDFGPVWNEWPFSCGSEVSRTGRLWWLKKKKIKPLGLFMGGPS